MRKTAIATTALALAFALGPGWIPAIAQEAVVTGEARAQEDIWLPGQINRFTFETTELMHETIQRWAQELPVGADGAPAQAHMVELAFDLLEDPADRDYFNALPTSFDLDDEQVDRLIAVARELMRLSPQYQDLLRALGGSYPCPADDGDELCLSEQAPFGRSPLDGN